MKKLMLVGVAAAALALTGCKGTDAAGMVGETAVDAVQFGGKSVYNVGKFGVTKFYKVGKFGVDTVAGVFDGNEGSSCGCGTAKTIEVKQKKSCNKCNLVFEDGTPAPCCRTVTKFSH